MPESHATSAVTEDREGQGLGHNRGHTDTDTRKQRKAHAHIYTQKRRAGSENNRRVEKNKKESLQWD